MKLEKTIALILFIGITKFLQSQEITKEYYSYYSPELNKADTLVYSEIQEKENGTIYYDFYFKNTSPQKKKKKKKHKNNNWELYQCIMLKKQSNGKYDLYESNPYVNSRKRNYRKQYYFQHTNPDTKQKTDSVTLLFRPVFKGGERERAMFLAMNLKYPEDARENGKSGNVLLSFTITKSGKVKDIEIENSVYPSLDQEAIRVLKLSSGMWIPAIADKQLVECRFKMPIKFVM